MSYKIGLLLSMVFVAMFFLFGAANNISYLISSSGVIDEEFIDYIESSYHVDFDCSINLTPTFGEEIVYSISTKYRPMIIDKKEMTIVISRMTVVGFYG